MVKLPRGDNDVYCLPCAYAIRKELRAAAKEIASKERSSAAPKAERWVGITVNLAEQGDADGNEANLTAEIPLGPLGDVGNSRSIMRSR